MLFEVFRDCWKVEGKYIEGKVLTTYLVRSTIMCWRALHTPKKICAFSFTTVHTTRSIWSISFIFIVFPYVVSGKQVVFWWSRWTFFLGWWCMMMSPTYLLHIDRSFLWFVNLLKTWECVCLKHFCISTTIRVCTATDGGNTSCRSGWLSPYVRKNRILRPNEPTHHFSRLIPLHFYLLPDYIIGRIVTNSFFSFL